MRLFPRGLWRYAVLIVLLLILAGVASHETINSITDLVMEAKTGGGNAVSDETLFRIVDLPVLALTMGFLFLAGALGVWAIRSTALVESRRRIGRFVDAMDYLSDGLVAVDRRGRVTGSNPAARDMAGTHAEARDKLIAMFPCLSEDEARRLLDSAAPREVECVSRDARQLRALRFRSQPSEDINLVLVSDVTGQKAEEMRGRQVARLQLIGRIARGVAHDFNNILSAVSGYAAVLGRSRRPGDEESLRAIVRESERGAALASQLLDLSRTGVRGNPCARLAERIEKAVTLLRVGLSPEWEIITDVSGEFAPVSLTDVQVEQVLVNLGLLAADELPSPGFVHVRARQPGAEPMFDVGDEFAAVVIIAAYGSRPEMPERFQTEATTTAAEAGVIQSVVRSVLEEVGGRLDVLLSRSRRHSYRLCLPLLSTAQSRMSATAGLPEELRDYIANWRVLAAGPGRDGKSDVERQLKDVGMVVRSAQDIVAALQHVEADQDLNALVIDKVLLGEEADALLRAILKLRPYAGIVVLCKQPEAEPEELRSGIVFEKEDPSPDAVLQALLRSEELAGVRKRTRWS